MIWVLGGVYLLVMAAVLSLVFTPLQLVGAAVLWALVTVLVK